MPNKYANAVQRGVCRGCNTDQPVAACNDPTCPTNQPWIEADSNEPVPEPAKLTPRQQRMAERAAEWSREHGIPASYWRPWQEEQDRPKTWIDTNPPGLWAVCNSDPRHWSIIRTDTGGTKVIGPVTPPRARSNHKNYFDRAMEEATLRNQRG